VIVKDTKYIDLAYDCIRSFLAFHPNSKFEVYVDEATSAEMLERLMRRDIINKCTIVMVEKSGRKWQEIKLDVILSQSGTKRLFMDADLRWYGSLPTIDNLTFLVDEGLLKNSEVFRKILELNPKFNVEAHMLNVSFVALGGKSISSETQQKIRETCFNYDPILDEVVDSIEDIESVRRLREQFAFSVYAHEISTHYSVLKESDSRAERDSLVSSCYFGSTGLNF
jgi:hypothetical protein